MKKLLLIFLLFSSFCQAQVGGVIGAISSGQRQNANTLIRSIDAEFYKYQRDDTPFVVDNTSVGLGFFTWALYDISDPNDTQTGVLYDYETTYTPEFGNLPVGYYVLIATVNSINPDPVGRIFWDKQITVLPEIFSEGEADRVLSLDDGNNIYDATSWTAGEKIFLKKIDATVGRIRIDNYNSAASRAHLLVDPSSEMVVDAFTGSHGLYLVNCQGLLIDAVGTTDTYGLYLNGEGDNTSHGINLNTVSDIRCAGIEIYGVKIKVPQSGASGIRMLGDESATYNRDDPPLENFKFGHIWIVEAGHEGGYFGYTDDTDGGNGGPRQFSGLWAWDWIVDDTGRDPIQPCNQINAIIHDWVINAAGTLGEPAHNSYISHNAGNQDIKIFNIRAKGGVHPMSIALGVTGTNPMIWNCTFEAETLPDQTSWNFIQTDAGPTTDLTIANVTFIANTGDEIVYRLDASTGGGNTRDIDDFTLINCTTIKGTSANLFTKDGTNPEDNWDRTSGNLTYTPATASNAKLHATTHLPNASDSPSIDGGVAWTTRRTAAQFLGKFGSNEYQYDIDGYIIMDGEYPSGAGSGTELKLADL